MKYALRKNNDTKEIHIHETQRNKNGRLKIFRSICKNSMDINSSRVYFNQLLYDAVVRDELLFESIYVPAIPLDFDFLSSEDQMVNKLLDEQQVRDVCAKLGRGVCGTCLSHFYKTL